MNDQENGDLQSEVQDDSAPNEQLPTHLASSSETENHSNLGMTSYNLPAEIIK